MVMKVMMVMMMGVVMMIKGYDDDDYDDGYDDDGDDNKASLPHRSRLSSTSACQWSYGKGGCRASGTAVEAPSARTLV